MANAHSMRFTRLFSYHSKYRKCVTTVIHLQNQRIICCLKTPAPTFFPFNNSPLRHLSQMKPDESEKIQTLKTETVAEDQPEVKISQKARLKQAVRDYGATIIVFHVAISLASLGICYLAISNGVDAVRLLTFLGFSESVINSKIAVGGSTFVMSYAVHKVFAPVRIGITLSVVPFIVRYLRKIKWLKPPKK